MYFIRTKQIPAIEQQTLQSRCDEVASLAFLGFGRRHYQPVLESEMVLWLARTRVDRFRWQEGFAGKPEFVCCSFSLLLWALLEQQRITDNVTLPLAVCRISTLEHSMVGFFNEGGEFRTIEPQTDAIQPLRSWGFSHPQDDVQTLIFL